MESKLKEIVKQLVKEIQDEKELDEMTGTGAVAGYNTPAAFSKPGQTAKKNNRLAKVSGGTVVDTLEEGEKDWALGDIPASRDEAFPMKPTAAGKKNDGSLADVSGMILIQGDDDAHLNENRWLAIKKEDGSAKAKIGKGISSIHNQLTEVEKFVNWYSKIKTENGVKKEDYYKRTHKSLGKIKERLMNLSEKIRTL